VYLSYTKVLAYLGERTFLVSEIQIQHDEDGSILNQYISKKPSFSITQSKLVNITPLLPKPNFRAHTVRFRPPSRSKPSTMHIVRPQRMACTKPRYPREAGNVAPEEGALTKEIEFENLRF
jgi:hypothetical protein